MATEKRLKDVSLFEKALEKHRGLVMHNEDILAALANCPTVDAVEVAHGRCEYCKDEKSFIGARMLLGNDGKWHDINNCPNCGAKMDGDEGD